MSDIRNECPLECMCKDENKLICDDEYCIRYKAYKKGRADERKKAEQDFQNSDYWNDYLAKVLADERAKLLKEICEHERTMIDDDGKIHFVVKMIDVVKVFNKEQKNEH